MRNRYNIGTVFFDGMECNERFSHGNTGRITIGGDRGDIDALSALNSENAECEEGVALENVTLLTTLDLDENEIEDEVRTVVEACYDSIQAETFIQRGRGDH